MHNNHTINVVKKLEVSGLLGSQLDRIERALFCATGDECLYTDVDRLAEFLAEELETAALDKVTRKIVLDAYVAAVKNKIEEVEFCK